MSADLVARLRDAYYGEMPVYQEPLHLEAADEIERLLALHRASYTTCPRMPQCWEAANLIDPPEIAYPLDVMVAAAHAFIAREVGWDAGEPMVEQARDLVAAIIAAVKEESSSRPPDVASAPASPQFKP